MDGSCICLPQFFLVPSSGLAWLAGKSTCLRGGASSNCCFSIVMLVFRGVTCWFLPTMNHPKEGKLFRSDLPSFWGVCFGD